MGPTDEECVRQCLGEHPEAFRHFVQRNQGPLLRYLRGRLGNDDEAAEVAQETFVRAYFGLAKLNEPRAFFSWLLGIANRVAKENHRAETRCGPTVALRSDPADTATGEDDGPGYRIAGAVAELPEVYRQVVLLRYYAGMSCAQISRDLDTPLGTVTKRLSRAYSLLRKSLREPRQKENVEAQP